VKITVILAIVMAILLVINSIYILVLKNLLQTTPILSFAISMSPAIIIAYSATFKKEKTWLNVAMAILYFYTGLIAFTLTVMNDVDLFPIDYQLYGAITSVIAKGHLESKTVEMFLSTLSDYNFPLYLYAIIEMILNSSFRIVAPFVNIFFVLVKLVIVFKTFKFLLNSEEKALYATLFSIFIPGAFQSHIPTVSGYANLTFYIAFYFFVKAFRKGVSLADILSYALLVTSIVESHPVASISLIVFVISIVITSSLQVRSRLWFLAIIPMLIFFLQTYTHTGLVLENMIKKLRLPILQESVEVVRYKTGRIDPTRGFLDYLVYIGLALLVFFAIISFITSLRENNVYQSLPMIFSGLAFLALTIIISGSFAGITDFIIRFTPYIFLAISFLSSQGFSIANMHLTRYSSKSLVKIAMFASLLFIISLPLNSLPTYVYYRTYPLRSDEPIAVPEEWYSVGIFFKEHGTFPASIYGAFNAYYVYALCSEKGVKFYFGHPLDFPHLYMSNNSYLLFSSLHLSLPDYRFTTNRTISRAVFNDILACSNMFYDSGNVFAFQVICPFG